MNLDGHYGLLWSLLYNQSFSPKNVVKNKTEFRGMQRFPEQTWLWKASEKPLSVTENHFKQTTPARHINIGPDVNEELLEHKSNIITRNENDFGKEG